MLSLLKNIHKSGNILNELIMNIIVRHTYLMNDESLLLNTGNLTRNNTHASFSNLASFNIAAIFRLFLVGLQHMQ